MSDLRNVIEAILFVAESPVSVAELAAIADAPDAEVETVIEGLERELAERSGGIVLRRAAGGWRFYTAPAVLPYLERFAASDRATRLSNAALETLAVVAYKQPVSRGQIAEVRGVDSERALRTLERRGLVRPIGTAPGPGQALLYGTTELFLEKLGVDGLQDLPPLADHVPPADVVETLERPFRPEGSSNDSTS